jgi:pimeloyl-ACP methyl ester carboxylesterase
MATKPEAFALVVPDQAIADLRDRLARTRYPDQAPGAPWAYGTDVSYMQQLVEYWRTTFDWRAEEARLNAFPQYKVPLCGIDLHFLHVPGKGPASCPLLLLHGWPGSVFEFLELIPRLTDPARFGGDPADSFTVVAPSLPGYGLSFTPGQPRFGIEEIADCVAELMRDALGYTRFAVQGGDWGAITASRLGYAHPEKLIGIHLNLLAIRRDQQDVADPTPEEKVYLDERAVWLRDETGYQWIQGTKPQTLAFALTDSPAGLAAWIIEKFRTWSDCGGNVETAFTRDRLLANIRPLLVHRRDRLVFLAVLWGQAPAVAHSRRANHQCSDRVRPFPSRDRAAASLAGGTHLHRYPALERHAVRRPFRGP